MIDQNELLGSHPGRAAIVRKMLSNPPQSPTLQALTLHDLRKLSIAFRILEEEYIKANGELTGPAPGHPFPTGKKEPHP